VPTVLDYGNCIRSYLSKDPNLEGEYLPRAASTVYRVLKEAGRILMQQHAPLGASLVALNLRDLCSPRTILATTHSSGLSRIIARTTQGRRPEI
jgi:hypothetical protein